MAKKEEKTPLDKVMIIIGYIAVGYIAYIIISFLFGFSFSSPSYEFDSRILDSDNQKLIKIHIEILEEDGYEVLIFGYLGSSPGDSPYVKMKSLGTRQYQVEDGLSSLLRVYPNAEEYTIRIVEETKDCWYIIPGGIDVLEKYNLIQSQIENPNCF